VEHQDQALTEPYDHGDSAEVEPSPVGITGTVDVRNRVTTSPAAADFGAYSSAVFAGTETLPRMVLPEDPARTTAYLYLGAGPGPVYVGSLNQCQAVALGNTNGGGVLLPTGITLPVGHRQAVYVVPDGSHAATVAIVNERRQLP
jgi:hypothetical protein